MARCEAFSKVGSEGHPELEQCNLNLVRWSWSDIGNSNFKETKLVQEQVHTAQRMLLHWPLFSSCVELSQHVKSPEVPMHAVACAFCVYSDIEREYSVSLCTHRIQNAIIHPKLLSGMVCVCVNACIPGIHRGCLEAVHV